jgi:hypothetical protein
MKIENTKPVGEKYTEFEKGDGKGLFNCDNCIHMNHDEGVCEHPVMISISKQPRKDGKPKVGKTDCCKFVRRTEE